MPGSKLPNFHIIGDKLINPIVGVYIPIIRIPIKGGMTIPNIATFDHGTYYVLYYRILYHIHKTEPFFYRLGKCIGIKFPIHGWYGVGWLVNDTCGGPHVFWKLSGQELCCEIGYPIGSMGLVYLQNGSLWGGEFSAKIFLKHWYLQCFPAMKALKPLF